MIELTATNGRVELDDTGVTGLCDLCVVEQPAPGQPRPAVLEVRMVARALGDQPATDNALGVCADHVALLLSYGAEVFAIRHPEP